MPSSNGCAHQLLRAPKSRFAHEKGPRIRAPWICAPGIFWAHRTSDVRSPKGFAHESFALWPGNEFGQKTLSPNDPKPETR